jgi:hypothetical protein
VMPLGSVPVSLSAGVGDPVAVTVKVVETPRGNARVAGLVIVGAWAIAPIVVTPTSDATAPGPKAEEEPEPGRVPVDSSVRVSMLSTAGWHDLIPDRPRLAWSPNKRRCIAITSIAGSEVPYEPLHLHRHSNHALRVKV